MTIAIDAEPLKLNDHVTISGGAADMLREHFGPVCTAIARADGPRAFENPFSSTVVHEAGHAVLYATMGEEVTCLSVKRLLYGKHWGQWTGFTDGGPRLLIGPEIYRHYYLDMTNRIDSKRS